MERLVKTVRRAREQLAPKDIADLDQLVATWRQAFHDEGVAIDGDAIILLATLLMERLETAGLTPEGVVEARFLLGEAAVVGLLVSEGEHLQA